MPGKIVLINEEIMITIQLPEFTINHIEMFVTEIRHDLIDVVLFLEQLNDLQIDDQARLDISIVCLSTIHFTCIKSLFFSSGTVIFPDQHRFTA